MKKLILLCALFGSLALPSKAQFQFSPPWTSTTEAYSQMWNILSSYHDVSLPLGQQIDTINASGSLNLYTSRFNTRSTKADTVYVAPIFGTGKISFTVSAWRATLVSTVSPVVTATLYSSPDGYQWAPVSGVSVLTLTPTASFSNSVSPTSASWQYLDKQTDYYKIGLAASSADTASVYCVYHFLKNATYNVKQ